MCQRALQDRTDPRTRSSRTIDDVELATLSWVRWYNTQRLHGYPDDVPPDEYEEAHYAQTATTGTIGNQ